ncbi:hypothetical protein SNE40_014774 [Patella caerulea]|uniref:Uncharacterized protein n=1 Tax=Patella caerulea TaxID=87958 RepID=A0AAN8PDI3_PATCE
MMKFVIFTLCLVLVAEGAIDLKSLFGNTDKGTCTPACGDGECCVSFYPPIASRRQISIDTSKFLPHRIYPGKVYMCQKIKQSGDKCLTHNTGEWCDCLGGLSCAPKGTTGLDRFFGTCTTA